MVKISKCPNCTSAYEPGDRFCQECGVPLANGTTPPGAATGGGWSWRGRLGLLTVNNAPAELILVAAAVAYVASAVLWSKQHDVVAFWKHISLPAAESVHATAGGAGHKLSAARPAPPPSPSPEKPAAAAAGPVMQVRSQVTNRAAAPSEGARHRLTTDTQASHHLPPVVLSSNRVPAVVPMQERRIELPGESPSAQERPPAKPAAKPQDIKDFVEYNRLLADYFSQSPDREPKEPPSFDEWVASKKPAF